MKAEDIYKDSRILIVDDNEANLFLLHEMLSDEGYKRIKTTTDPYEAIKIFKSGIYDLMLLDIQMPKLDGLGVLKILNENMPDDYLPILVLTAQQDIDTRMRALSEGAKDFLTKPFINSEVLLRVFNLLEIRHYHTLLNQEKRLLEYQVRIRTREIEQTRLEIINRLCMASEFRDTETGEHILRIGKFSHLLAKELGMDDEYCNLMLHAAPMHDIGKIGIPDHILLKPGKFIQKEWDIMRNHVTIGAKLLDGDDAPLLKMAHDIALTHHEKWDGTGYPNSLSGEDIPLGGRICTICDVFDALTSARPYKEAWSFEDAKAYILDNKGIHFDPMITDQFEKSVDIICQIKIDCPDTPILRNA